MVLTLLTKLYSTYNTKLAIPTYKEILIYNVRYATNNTILYLQYKTGNTYLQRDTLLTVLYSTLYIYTKKNPTTCTTYITDYIRYKNQKIKGGKYGKF